MNYTRFILSNKFININALQPKNKILVVPMVAIGTPVAVLGILTTIFFLPIAYVTDGFRRIKYNLIRFKRKNNYYYGSQTHFSYLCRDYIRIPYLVHLGHRPSPIRRIPSFRKTKRRDRMPWWFDYSHLGDIYNDLGRILLVVNNQTSNKEYG